MPGGVLVGARLAAPRRRAAITSGGPSASGKPWPRLTDPVRTASADICEKIVGGMPCEAGGGTAVRHGRDAVQRSPVGSRDGLC